MDQDCIVEEFCFDKLSKYNSCFQKDNCDGTGSE